MSNARVRHICIGSFLGYNLKNTRRGKRISKKAKWATLSPLVLKSEFILQFEFSENLEDFYGKCC